MLGAVPTARSAFIQQCAQHDRVGGAILGLMRLNFLSFMVAIRALPLAAVIALLTGCASPLTVKPVVHDGQRLTYDSGNPRLTSSKTYTITLQIQSTVVQAGKPLEIAIVVFNPTARSLEVSTDNIRASWKGALLKVFSFEELMAKEQRQQSIQRIGLALQAFGAGVSGGRSTTYETGSLDATYRGYGGTGTVTGTYAGQRDTYDPAAAAVAQQAVDNKIRSFKTDSAAATGFLERALFRRHTLAANTAYAGLVRIAVPDQFDQLQRIFVTVDIQGDAHIFALDVAPMKQRP